MHLPAIDLPSTKGARVTVTAKTFQTVARQAEEHAALLRSEAEFGASHPMTIVDFYRRAVADLAAIEAATEAEIAAIEQALKALDGEPTVVSQHPIIATAREMKRAAVAFSKAGSEIVRDKAATLVSDTRLQLKAANENASQSLAMNRHRLEAIHSKAADALRSAVAKHEGQLLISLKDAAELLKLPAIPDNDTAPLPAADFNPRLSADHPARKAAVLVTICRSKEAEAAAMKQHIVAKKAKGERQKTPADMIRGDLAMLGDA